MLSDRLGILGRTLGLLLAPLAGAVSVARRARMFHPEGVVYRAEAFARSPSPAAQRLAGPALVRFSGAWWRRRQWPDLLGVAVRLRGSAEPSAEPAPGDQDLIFATIRRPWTAPLAPLSTRVHDYLANDYYGVSPFLVAGIGRRYLRLVSIGTPPPPNLTFGGDRAARLERAVAAGQARLELQISTNPRSGYVALAEVRLVAPVPPEGPGGIDQAALHFSPFRDGRGLRPVGLIHRLRRAASQGV